MICCGENREDYGCHIFTETLFFSNSLVKRKEQITVKIIIMYWTAYVPTQSCYNFFYRLEEFPSWHKPFILLYLRFRTFAKHNSSITGKNSGGILFDNTDCSIPKMSCRKEPESYSFQIFPCLHRILAIYLSL